MGLWEHSNIFPRKLMAIASSLYAIWAEERLYGNTALSLAGNWHHPSALGLRKVGFALNAFCFPEACVWNLILAPNTVMQLTSILTLK